MANAGPINHHRDGLARLHESEEFSDCKLICGPYHFNLHKVILASQSDYFKTAFKQGTFKEGDSGVIEPKTAESDHATSNDGEDAYDEPEIVKLMVEYFYHFDYLRGTDSELVQVSASDLQSPPQLPSQVYLIEHAKVFAIAVKYQIEGLRELAVSKFHTAATGLWKHDDFAHSVHIVFNSTAEEVTQLRVIASDILHQHFDVLKEKAEIEAVVCNIPRLAYALLKRSRAGGKTENVKTGKQSQYTEGTCRDCGLDWNSSATLSKLGRHGQGKSTSYHWYCSYCE